MTITATQELFLEILERMTFNKCDGGRIAAELRRHKHLWRSALPTRPIKPVFTPLQNPVTNPGPSPSLANRIDLIPLRDLPSDHVNLDTLAIWAEAGRSAELEQLARDWSPAELTWYNAREAFRAMGQAAVRHREYGLDDPTLLVVWWD